MTLDEELESAVKEARFSAGDAAHHVKQSNYGLASKSIYQSVGAIERAARIIEERKLKEDAR